LGFGHLEFEFVSSFDIRISDFDLLFGDAKAFATSCEEFPGHNLGNELDLMVRILIIDYCFNSAQ